MARVKRWWSRKYNLPPNHGLLENQTMGELLLEMYEDAMVEREDVQQSLSRGDGSVQEMQSRLRELNVLLDGEESDEFKDDLIDKWERELLEGNIPDLDEEQ